MKFSKSQYRSSAAADALGGQSSLSAQLYFSVCVINKNWPITYSYNTIGTHTHHTIHLISF